MWGKPGNDRDPVFIPKAALCVDPITVAAGTVVTIDAAGVSNNGVLIVGSPKVQDFQVIEWTAANDALVQAYLDGNATRLSAPTSSRADAIAGGLAAYNIKNTGAGAITLHIWGM